MADRRDGQPDFDTRASPQPEALGCFLEWSERLKEQLPARMAEAIALTVATRTGDRHGRVQHELLALAQGMTREEIVAVETGELGSVETLSEAENAAAALGRCLIDDFGRGCGPALLRLARCTDEATAVGCLMMAARSLAHSTMANVWRLEPPAGSPLDGRDGAGRGARSR